MARAALVPTCELVIISPEMAAEWLQMSGPNRAIKRRQLAILRRSIRNGEWLVNGESIVFDVNGKLVDGQHRLTAISQEDQACAAIVVRGVSEKAYRTIDLGSRRNNRDVLHIENRDHAGIVADVIGYLYRWSIGRELARQGSVPTPTETVMLFDANPGLGESIPFGRRVGEALGTSKALLTFLHYAFASADAEKADTFFEGLEEGADLPKTSPILIARRQIINSLRRHARVGKRHDNRDVQRVLTLAWNDYYSGEDRQRAYTWTPKDEFPPIVGCELEPLILADAAP